MLNKKSIESLLDLNVKLFDLIGLRSNSNVYNRSKEKKKRK